MYRKKCLYLVAKPVLIAYFTSKVIALSVLVKVLGAKSIRQDTGPTNLENPVKLRTRKESIANAIKISVTI